MSSFAFRVRVLAWAAVLGHSCVGIAAADELVALPGHVLPALSAAARVEVRAKALAADAEPVTLTVVLRREQQVAFDAFLADLQDPGSPVFRRFLSPVEVSDRYGPSQESYDLVKAYFESRGFTLAEGSANRMTLTFRGTRAMAEAALSVPIVDYRIGGKVFRANASDPKLPSDLAWRVQAVVGMSDLAQPRPLVNAIHNFCNGLANNESNAEAKKQIQDFCSWLDTKIGYPKRGIATVAAATPLPPGDATPTGSHAGAAAKAGNADWASVSGAGQKIGIVAFDTFAASNVADYLALMDLSPNLGKLSQTHVNGGAPAGNDEAEVLIDVATVMTIAPGADVVVFDAPFTGGGTSFQTVLNAMIGAGVTIITNSWAYCEDQTTLADVQSIDAIFAAAAASGISAFNASGDSGSTCLDGSPSTIAVPASSPHATAVGGTSHVKGPGRTYGAETWWNGTGDTPPTGQGGFGLSKFFARPAFQDPHVASAMRSIPDVAINADPARGIVICQASAGGCPTPQLWGGTSMAAPAWAAVAALMNEAAGQPMGDFNQAIYPYAGPNAFHDAASMGSDFAHVGLGSPNSDALSLALAGQALGPPSGGSSSVLVRSAVIDGVEVTPPSQIPADGVAQAIVVVTIRDANRHAISGKTVSLAANPGSSAVIAPASAATTGSHPFATFTITDLTAEAVTLTATDVTDGIVLTQTANVTFGVPPAAAASIAASPVSLLNDGIATTSITVTLVDALSRPTPGKLITLSQGSGHSIVSGPNPSVTDATGKIVFTATNTHAETVTYTAVDVTDGDLDVPGSAVVDFTGQPTSTCATVVPTAAAGYAITPWSSGYAASAFSYSGINFGCAGALNPVFDSGGNAWVPSYPDGKLFRLPPDGGAPTSGLLLATHGPTLGQPAFGKDGRLYVARTATGGGSSSGAIYELDPDDGSILRTVVSGITCPQEIAVDPLSGDLFFGDICFGGGIQDARVFRVSDPAGTPSLSTYATLPGSPTGVMVFAPDGTLYAQSNYLDASPKVERISGTDKPQPATVTEVSGLTSVFWLTVAQTLPTGAVKSLVVLGPSGLRLADITTNPPTYTELTVGQTASGTVGPDGCLYFTAAEAIFRLTTSDGDCGFVAASATPSLTLSPGVVTPDPAQGTSVTMTATFSNLTVPAGTPVLFGVNGDNAQLRLATTDGSGAASIALLAIVDGDDKVVASATVGSTTYTSNAVKVHWTPGKHATYLTVALSPGGGTQGATTALKGTLYDVTATPNLPLAGETIHFTLGALACDGVTGADGTASCDVVPDAIGAFALSARYDGSASYLPSTAGDTFMALAVPDPTCFDGPLPSGGSATACLVGGAAECQFTSAAFVTAASVGAPPPAGVSLPFGLFRFTATGCGSSVTLSVTYPGPVPAGAAYWKFGPTAGEPAHWYSLPAGIAGNELTVTLVDGGAGDSDLAVNGSISDPGGAGIQSRAPAVVQSVPTLDRYALLVLSLLVAAMAMGVGARGRRTRSLR